MKNIFCYYALFVLFCTDYQASAQQTFHLIKSHLIGAVREDPSNPEPSEFDVRGYPPSQQVVSIWTELTRSVRTSSNAALINSIEIHSASTQSIYSTNSTGTNLIFYDESFFNQFQGIAGIDVDYLILFSLAHELGHFVKGDVRYVIKTKESESIADIYACNLLCQMNKATKSKISSVILALDGASFSNYYFNKGERIKILNRYFDKGMCVSNILSDQFDSEYNPHGFYVGNLRDFYSASIDTVNKQYRLVLDSRVSKWGWTYAHLADKYVNAFASNENVKFSFDFTSALGEANELVGYISQPSCVTDNCPGGSHYDLWFRKLKQQNGSYNISSMFFYNDNCSCSIGNSSDDVDKQTTTGVVSHITIVKHSQIYTVFVDDNQVINFKYTGNLISTLLWGDGTHFLTNFRLEVLR